MRGRRRLPKSGRLVSVEWVDITSTTNADLVDAKPVKCTTTGRLVKKTDTFIVIATSLFDEPGPDISGDFVAIPLGVLEKVTTL